MNEIKITVLTPLYRTKPGYVRRCLASLQAQTLQEVEFLLIDNGADEENKRLISEFEQADARFRALHLQVNIGMGAALNRGLDVARGDYIGFLESDDYADPEMYAALYEKSGHGQIDVVKSLYRTMEQHGALKLENHFPEEQTGRYLTQGRCTGLIQGHVSHWSGIYRRAFLCERGIRFNETPGGHSQDFGFILKCYAHAQSVYIHPRAYVTYRLYTGNHEPEFLNACMIDECELTLHSLRRARLPLQVWETLFRRIAPRLMACLPTVSARQRRRIAKMLLSCEKRQNYSLFSPEHRKAVRAFLKAHDLKRRLWRCIYRRERGEGYCQVYVLGLPVYARRVCSPQKTKVRYAAGLIRTVRKGDSFKLRALGVPVISKKDTRRTKYLRFFGVPLYYRCNKWQSLQDRMEELQRRLADMGALLAEQGRCHHTMQLWVERLESSVQAGAIHEQSFGKYRRAFSGRDVVLVCTGPTAKSYVPIDGAIHVGVNGAIYLDLDLDFVFIQDNTMNQPGNSRLTTDVLRYSRNNCRKFIGIPPQRLRRINLCGEKKLFPISVADYGENTSPYILSMCDIESRDVSQLPYDISREPLANMYGTPFSAMQFILYTNPKTVYLVGCDCSSGYAYDASRPNFLPLSPQVDIWKLVKEYAAAYYPSVEIKCLNPVGLKGVFPAADVDLLYA